MICFKYGVRIVRHWPGVEETEVSSHRYLSAQSDTLNRGGGTMPRFQAWFTTLDTVAALIIGGYATAFSEKLANVIIESLAHKTLVNAQLCRDNGSNPARPVE